MFDDILNDSIVFAFFGFINQVRVVNTFWRTVCRNLYNVQIVNFTEFFFFRHSSTCHTGQFVIQAEKVLEGNGCQCFAFTSNGNAFFCFNCLVQTFIIATSVHNTAGKFVNNKNFPAFYYVVDIFLHNTVRFDSLVNMVLQCNIF